MILDKLNYLQIATIKIIYTINKQALSLSPITARAHHTGGVISLFKLFGPVEPNLKYPGFPRQGLLGYYLLFSTGS
jgi:hypothetical protein